MANVFDTEGLKDGPIDEPRQATPQDMVDTIRGLRRQVESLRAELVMLKGPCSNRYCQLHYGHVGPCDTRVDI